MDYPEQAIDYRIAMFEGKTRFTEKDIEKAWEDGRKWGENNAKRPKKEQNT